MNFLYGDDHLLRVLDEVEFWKQQESEHTTVIEQIVPNLEEQYKNVLNEFRNSFSQTQGQSVRLVETVIRSKGRLNPNFNNTAFEFLEYAINESQGFIDFLNEIKQNSQALQENPIAVVVIDHIIRESEYFIGISQTILAS